MKFKRPKGTKDILPSEILKWHFIENKIRQITSLFNFHEIRTPTFELSELFSRGVGSQTDIVSKEMYSFTDKGGDSLTLRPEGTASVVRAILENSLLQSNSLLKLYYIASMFRREKPQAGRFREHTQFGAEIIGSDSYFTDIEVIMLASELFHQCGISNFIIKINSIGKLEERNLYISELKKYLKSNLDQLSDDSKRRFEINPLRILDSKNQNDIEITSNAPKILDFLSNESKLRFDNVVNELEKLNIIYEIDFRLVRGLDYYTDTTFEFVCKSLGAQDAIGGGGRYDGLFKQLGGKDIPGVGFGSGIERILIAAQNNKFNFKTAECIKIYFIALNNDSKKIAYDLITKLRQKNISCDTDFLNRSLKSQLRDADKLKAEFVYIIGENEIKKNKGILKKMSDSSQIELGFQELINYNFNIEN
jgi:histidyl-tRNA synthetase